MLIACMQLALAGYVNVSPLPEFYGSDDGCNTGFIAMMAIGDKYYAGGITYSKNLIG